MEKISKILQTMSAKFYCIFIGLCLFGLGVLAFLLFFTLIGFVFHYYVMSNDISAAINNTMFALRIIIGMLLLSAPFALFYWWLGFFEKKGEK